MELKEFDSVHEKQQFEAIESLVDTIYENLDKSIDMHKGLLNPLNDVFYYLLLLLSDRNEESGVQSRQCSSSQCGKIQRRGGETAASF